MNRYGGYNRFNSFKDLEQLQREEEAFQQRKQQIALKQQLGQQKLRMAPLESRRAQLENQKLQKELELGVAGNDPAAIREWNIYSQLPDDQKQQYLKMKRSDKVLNLGGTQAVLSPTGGIAEQFPVTPKPEQMPAFKAEQARVVGQAKVEQERTSELEERVSQMPELERVVSKLRDLSGEATYSLPKQAIDWTAAQSGYGATEGAIARSKYQAIIDNEILPLLRQTFGAQFTQQEGESLKKTLGDVDKTPEEKQAVLDTFMETKRGQIEALKRQQGQQAEAVVSRKDSYQQGEAAFKLRKAGYTDDQIKEYLQARGQ